MLGAIDGTVERAEPQDWVAESPLMKKFSNTLAGTDCGDAGLATPCDNIAGSDRSRRIIPKRPEKGAPVIQFPSRPTTPTSAQGAQNTGCRRENLDETI
jgi:hypothetical protein